MGRANCRGDCYSFDQGIHTSALSAHLYHPKIPTSLQYHDRPDSSLVPRIRICQYKSSLLPILSHLALLVNRHQAQIFSSKPVSQGWTKPGLNTINEPAFLLSMGAINMVLDIVTVCLPLFVIRTLHMSLKRKWSVAGVFALGFT